ncbi:MAG: type II secretion system F family protein [bacterium]
MLFVALMTLGITVLIYLVYLIIDRTYFQRIRVRQRMAYLKGKFVLPADEEADAVVSEEERFPTLAKFIAGKTYTDRLLMQLLRSGVKLRPSEYVGFVFGLALFLALLSTLFTRNIGAQLLGIFVGLVCPYYYLKAMEARRLVTFNRQIPDALSLMSSAIRSGFSFQRAMMLVAEELPDPIAEEFRRFNNETSVGLQTDTALLRMGTRVPSYDLQLVITAIIIQQQTGGNLSEIIDKISETIRERIRIEGEVAALTAEGKISGAVLVLLPIGLAVVISLVNPSYLKPLLTDPLGNMIILIAIGMQVLGAIIINKMLVLDF